MQWWIFFLHELLALLEAESCSKISNLLSRGVQSILYVPEVEKQTTIILHPFLSIDHAPEKIHHKDDDCSNTPPPDSCCLLVVLAPPALPECASAESTFASIGPSSVSWRRGRRPFGAPTYWQWPNCGRMAANRTSCAGSGFRWGHSCRVRVGAEVVDRRGVP